MTIAVIQPIKDRKLIDIQKELEEHLKGIPIGKYGNILATPINDYPNILDKNVQPKNKDILRFSQMISCLYNADVIHFIGDWETDVDCAMIYNLCMVYKLNAHRYETIKG